MYKIKENEGSFPCRGNDGNGESPVCLEPGPGSRVRRERQATWEGRAAMPRCSGTEVPLRV